MQWFSGVIVQRVGTTDMIECIPSILSLVYRLGCEVKQVIFVPRSRKGVQIRDKKTLGLPMFFERLQYAKILQRLFVCKTKTR